MVKKEIDFKPSFEQINVSVKSLHNSVEDLHDVLFHAILDTKLVTTKFKCPICGTFLCYDYIGDVNVRLYCPNCKKFVLARIENLK